MNYADADVVIVHADTCNLKKQSDPEELANEIASTLRDINSKGNKAQVAFSGIIKRKDDLELNAKAIKINEVIVEKLMYSGFDFIDNNQIKYGYLARDGLHINDGGVRKLAANFSHYIKPWQSDWTFALNMHWTNVQCKMLRRFATLFNLVQSCSAMLRAAQSILKAVKNVQWTRLNFFCLKKMFSRFATPLNIVQFAQAQYKCKKGEFCHDGEEMVSSAAISSMNSRERYSGSNEDSSDKIN